MGCKELIDALLREGEEKVRMIWLDAEAEAEKIKADAKERISRMHEQYGRMQASAIKEQVEPIFSEARLKADAVRLKAENYLSSRLYNIALSMLGDLRGEGYRDVFYILFRELPPCKWKIVKVNPEDKGIAMELFPDSDIITDSSISGGLEVQTNEGDICISNTFEKRLQRAWVDILPELMRDIYGNLTGH